VALMVTRVATVAFEGIEARAVDVQVQVTPGGLNFMRLPTWFGPSRID